MDYQYIEALISYNYYNLTRSFEPYIRDLTIGPFSMS